ncbi:metallophosphoesterase [Gorillibacterium massiliense]|uniref:metallophosphoesterase n=1 Tax=Gorillibacterium massiliense TaxID=1280390 RepID=UPI0004AD9720|nr:metallophosphoesterase [Gorillibacterium massiliense]
MSIFIYLAAFSALIILFYLLFVFPTIWLKIERTHIGTGIGVKILQISDIHIERNRIKSRVIRHYLQQEKPDIICLTGDFTRRDGSLLRLIPFLEAVRDSGIPAYAVLGNHDYRLRRLQSLLTVLEKYGIVVLRNESVSFDAFTLVGIDDYCSKHHDLAASFRGARGDKPVIVMTHDPNVALEIKQRFHFLLAGHLHGKQFNIPYYFRLFPKGALPSRGIYKGLHQLENGPIYISKGIGQTSLNLRFLVRSEIAVHEL